MSLSFCSSFSSQTLCHSLHPLLCPSPLYEELCACFSKVIFSTFERFHFKKPRIRSAVVVESEEEEDLRHPNEEVDEGGQFNVIPMYSERATISNLGSSGREVLRHPSPLHRFPFSCSCCWCLRRSAGGRLEMIQSRRTHPHTRTLTYWTCQTLDLSVYNEIHSGEMDFTFLAFCVAGADTRVAGRQERDRRGDSSEREEWTAGCCCLSMPLHIHGIPAQDKARAAGKTNSAAGRVLSGEIKSWYKAQTER
ncbi:hypothetical protein WMY93_008932 [Mugilogobius chulae]|uniref:Uncharacterized protein n=1 Tax=Mugilogobius chulae TaxID=88201 RepID=A0AAW0PDY6_9GOBI